MRSITLAVLFGITLQCAQVVIVPAADAEGSATPTKQEEEAAKQANRNFAGFSFGVGFSATIDTGDNKRIESASIDPNGYVRVDKSSNVRARVILESHYLFPYGKLGKGEYMNRGWGPFFAVQPGEDEIIKAIGGGVMFAFRRDEEESAQSFNFGFGFIVDPEEKILGSEFKAGKLAPTGPGGDALPIRDETRDQGGFLLIASFAW